MNGDRRHVDQSDVRGAGDVHALRELRGGTEQPFRRVPPPEESPADDEVPDGRGEREVARVHHAFETERAWGADVGLQPEELLPIRSPAIDVAVLEDGARVVRASGDGSAGGITTCAGNSLSKLLKVATM